MKTCERRKYFSLDYLYSEYEKLNKNPINEFQCKVDLVNNDLYQWKITLIGPKDTPYEGGNFILVIYFKYPYSIPKVRFVNKIYHLNVSQYDGTLRLYSLKCWRLKSPMINIISDIYSSFYNQEQDYSYDSLMSIEYNTDRNEFNRKAKEWTKKYATKNNIIYNKKLKEILEN